MAPDNKLMVATVNTSGAAFEARGVQPLFDAHQRTALYLGYAAGINYDVSRDGQRFLVNAVLAEQSTTAITLVAVVVFYRAFLVGTFDERQAAVLGLHPRLAHIGLLVLLSVAIVSSFATVGNLLVFAFLVAPPATATLFAARVPAVIAAGAIIGSIAGVVGLLISYHHGTAAGATMALCAVAAFLVGLGGRFLRDRYSARYG